MAYNVEKARQAGIPDEQIAAYLQKSGRGPDEIKQLMGGGGFKLPVKGIAETVGMLGGQTAGAALGALGGPAAPVTIPAGRFIGGTLGNVAGTAAPEMLKNAFQTGRYALSMGHAPKPTMPNLDPKELFQSLKEGAQASALGEALPMAFKAGGAMRRAVSKDFGIGKGLSEVAEALTGQEANEFGNLTKKPRALLYRWMGGYKGAGRAWQGFKDVLEKKGIPAESVEFGARETNASVKNSVFDLMDMAKATKDKIIKQLPTAHVIKMMRATQEVIGSPETTRGFGDLKAFRGKLMAEMAERGDDIAEAWKDVSSSQLAKSFHTPAFGLLPKAGDKAQGYKAFYEIRRMLPFLVGGAGAASGHPSAAGLGLLFSPLAMGIPFAATGTAVKAALEPRAISTGVKALQNWRKEPK